MDVDEITPTFDVNLYKNSLLTPILGWAILQVLWWFLSWFDGDTNSVSTIGTMGFGSSFAGSEGFAGTTVVTSIPSPAILLLFGAWAGISLTRNGGNTGDGMVGGLIIGTVAWVIWFIFFGLFDPANLDPDFSDFILPMWSLFILYHFAASITLAGITSDPSKRPERPKKEKKVKETKPKETKAKESKEKEEEDKSAKKTTKKSTKKTTKKSTKSDEE